MTPPPRLLAPGRHRHRAVPIPSASPHPASSTASSSRGPGRLSTPPSQIQPSLIPDSPIPTTLSQRRVIVVAREMTGGESEEGEATSRKKMATLPPPRSLSNPPSQSSPASSPSPADATTSRHLAHGARSHRHLRHITIAAFTLSPKPDAMAGPSLRHPADPARCLSNRESTDLSTALMLSWGDDLDVRTGKPSLDIFLAEMRRFEFYRLVHTMERIVIAGNCIAMALLTKIVSGSCMAVQLFGDIKEKITIWREAGFMVGEKRLVLFLLQFFLSRSL
uniref:Uncharacterized protein n=2 Tax=Oryza nivara TaxID=4536 RepID=A0A0E0G7E4_ORYNI